MPKAGQQGLDMQRGRWSPLKEDSNERRRQNVPRSRSRSPRCENSVRGRSRGPVCQRSVKIPFRSFDEFALMQGMTSSLPGYCTNGMSSPGLEKPHSLNSPYSLNSRCYVSGGDYVDLATDTRIVGFTNGHGVERSNSLKRLSSSSEWVTEWFSSAPGNHGNVALKEITGVHVVPVHVQLEDQSSGLMVDVSPNLAMEIDTGHTGSYHAHGCGPRNNGHLDACENRTVHSSEIRRSERLGESPATRRKVAACDDDCCASVSVVHGEEKDGFSMNRARPSASPPPPTCALQKRVEGWDLRIQEAKGGNGAAHGPSSNKEALPHHGHEKMVVLHGQEDAHGWKGVEAGTGLQTKESYEAVNGHGYAPVQVRANGNGHGNGQGHGGGRSKEETGGEGVFQLEVEEEVDILEKWRKTRQLRGFVNGESSDDESAGDVHTPGWQGRDIDMDTSDGDQSLDDDELLARLRQRLGLVPDSPERGDRLAKSYSLFSSKGLSKSAASEDLPSPSPSPLEDTPPHRPFSAPPSSVLDSHLHLLVGGSCAQPSVNGEVPSSSLPVGCPSPLGQPVAKSMPKTSPSATSLEPLPTAIVTRPALHPEALSLSEDEVALLDAMPPVASPIGSSVSRGGGLGHRTGKPNPGRWPSSSPPRPKLSRPIPIRGRSLLVKDSRRSPSPSSSPNIRSPSLPSPPDSPVFSPPPIVVLPAHLSRAAPMAIETPFPPGLPQLTCRIGRGRSGVESPPFDREGRGMDDGAKKVWESDLRRALLGLGGATIRKEVAAKTTRKTTPAVAAMISETVDDWLLGGEDWPSTVSWSGATEIMVETEVPNDVQNGPQVEKTVTASVTAGMAVLSRESVDSAMCEASALEPQFEPMDVFTVGRAAGGLAEAIPEHSGPSCAVKALGFPNFALGPVAEGLGSGDVPDGTCA